MSKDTMDIYNEWHRARVAERPPEQAARDYLFVPAVEFNDGFYISIQAGAGKYSSPRRERSWPYSAFELGYPSAADDLIQDRAEDPESPTDTVYGYVPVATILALIEKHGGIKGVHTWPDSAAERA